MPKSSGQLLPSRHDKTNDYNDQAGLLGYVGMWSPAAEPCSEPRAAVDRDF
jgi:hypothetical protein